MVESSAINHIPWDLIQMQHGLHESERMIQKGCCLGFLDPSDVNEAPMEVTKRNISKMKNAMSQCNLTTIIQPLLDNDPYSYPTPIQMSNKQIEKHVVCCRWFDLSMLLFSVEACDCCDRLQPSYVDPWFPVSSEQPLSVSILQKSITKHGTASVIGFARVPNFMQLLRKVLSTYSEMSTMVNYPRLS
jgi:hypothetical protein